VRIRAAITFQDLSYDTKFDPSPSRETLPLSPHHVLLFKGTVSREIFFWVIS